MKLNNLYNEAIEFDPDEALPDEDQFEEQILDCPCGAEMDYSYNIHASSYCCNCNQPWCDYCIINALGSNDDMYAPRQPQSGGGFVRDEEHNMLQCPKCKNSPNQLPELEDYI